MTRSFPCALTALALSAVLFAAEPAQAREVTVTASALNVRSGPSTRYRVLGLVTEGKRLRLRGLRGSWAKVDFRTRTGWVHRDYIRGERAGGGGANRPTRPRSRAGFIQFRSSGRGFYSYTTPSRRWGRPALVYALERTGRAWARKRLPRFGVGDLSLENGGYFGRPTSHQRGSDVDIRPVKDRGEGPVTIFQRAYNRRRTALLIGMIRRRVATDIVLFNDRAVRGVHYYPGHDNHFHFEIR